MCLDTLLAKVIALVVCIVYIDHGGFLGGAIPYFKSVAAAIPEGSSAVFTMSFSQNKANV